MTGGALGPGGDSGGDAGSGGAAGLSDGSGAVPGRTGLLVLDVDSTLVTTEGIDLLADLAGVGPQVAEVTERAMRGELDFAASLRQRVALLYGLPADAIVQANTQVIYTPGAEDLVAWAQRAGWAVGVVSGGFTAMVQPLATQLGLDHYRANQLEIIDGRLTGQLVGPVIDRAAKATALRHWAAAHGIPLERTVAVGDGANDLDMLAAAGLSIGFGPKPVVKSAAQHSVPGHSLYPIIALLRPMAGL